MDVRLLFWKRVCVLGVIVGARVLYMYPWGHIFGVTPGHMISLLNTAREDYIWYPRQAGRFCCLWCRLISIEEDASPLEEEPTTTTTTTAYIPDVQLVL